MRHPSLLLASIWILLAAPLPVSAEVAAANEDNFLSRTRQLSYEGRRAGEGYFSADDKKLCFQSERIEGNPFYQIFQLDFETGETELVSTGSGKTTCAFFNPDATKILFGSTHLDENSAELQKAELDFRASGKKRRYSWDYDEHFDLFARDLDSGELTQLTDAFGYDAEANYSPDGRWIVFTSMRSAFLDGLDEETIRRRENDPSWFGEIYIMPATGGEATRLTTKPGYDGGPFFSPDGSRIIWRSFDESGMIADVWTMDLDGGNKLQVTDFACMSWAPYFHPSGEYIFFASNKMGFSNFEIYIVDSAGLKEPVRTTFTDGFDGLPVPSNDGKRIAFTSSRKGGDGAQIFMADWNHEAAQAALAAAPDRQPSGHTEQR